MDYVPTIGLEIHAELKTHTKMFCDSLNDPDPSTGLGAGEKRPNQNVCPVCLGHPGALPTINKQAVEAVIQFGLAVHGTVAPHTKFDRKNYFYPDLPKGYQISQFDEPLVTGGEVMLKKTGAKIHIRRVHLEEDAGKLVHEAQNVPARRSASEGGKHGAEENFSSSSELQVSSSKLQASSLVDFNRAGVPLMELVTEPDFKTAEEAVEFAKYLQLLLRYLGISDADMEKGQLRVEANISLGQWARGKWKMGTKVEVKNLNSFKAVGDAIHYETERQAEVLRAGGVVAHETRGWNDAERKTVSQRSKEEAHDYRYFPEPDLPPFETSIFDVKALRRGLPELPYAKSERFQKEYHLSEAQALALAEEPTLANFYEEAASELAKREEVEHEGNVGIKKAKELLYNYLTSDVKGLVGEAGGSLGKIRPEHLAHLVDLIADGKIMSRQAKDILRKMWETGDDPENILESEGLHTVSDVVELEKAIAEILEENPAAVADYKKGKSASLQFLIGKAMGKLKGRGSPETLKELFLKRLR